MESISDSYKKNRNLESLLSEINHYLEIAAVQPPELEKYKSLSEASPSLYIVGVPRSGTTILSQWLASFDVFCYPTNFVSRFYKAPFIGGLIQEMLFNKKYDYKEELSLSSSMGSFTSDVGKTKGPLEPHEFWYFWRRFFHFPEIPVGHEDFLRHADFKGFFNEIERYKQVFSRAFFMKALIMNPYILPLTKSQPNAIIVYIKRDIIANANSLIKTRLKYFSDEQTWFSFKPKEYPFLKDESPIRQVVGQSYFISKDIETQLSAVPDNQKWIISYEDFCTYPERYLEQLREKVPGLDIEGINQNVILNLSSSDRSLSSSNREIMDAVKWLESLNTTE